MALLSYMRYWTDRDRCADPSGPCLATIDPATILVAREGGKVEAIEGPQEDDVKAMEEDVLLAKRHNGTVMVSLHVHDVSHSRAYGIQDTTPPNEEIPFRRAIDAGADAVLGSGPHVLRGIELRDGKPIFYSLSNFIYQYRTPKVDPDRPPPPARLRGGATAERLRLGPPRPSRGDGERRGADDLPGRESSAGSS